MSNLKLNPKKYGSVLEMVKDTSDPEYAAEFEAKLKATFLSRRLAVMRTSQGLTQQALADKIGVPVDSIERLETSEDRVMTVGWIQEFLRALGYELRLEFVRTPEQEQA